MSRKRLRSKEYLSVKRLSQKEEINFSSVEYFYIFCVEEFFRFFCSFGS